MSLICVLLITISAGMHASWNLICKSKSPSGAFFLIATTSSVTVMLPIFIYFIPYYSSVPGKVWLLLAITGVVQAMYYVGLGNAYRLTEVSIAYPLARSLPVMLVPGVTMILCLGGEIRHVALIGMALVACGCIILPLKSFKSLDLKSYFTRGYLFILLAALGTTSYTIIDSEALRILNSDAGGLSRLKAALFYIAMDNFFIEIVLGVYIFFNASERRKLKDIVSNYVRYPIMSGVICTASYTLVLGAMMFASNVSYVAAFRQLSIPLGAVLGIIIFKERINIPKAVGLLLLFAGLVLVALN